MHPSQRLDSNRIEAGTTGAPPAFADSAPSAVKNSNDIAATPTVMKRSGVSMNLANGSAAPTAKDAADASAARTGLALTIDVIFGSSRAYAPSASWDVS